MKNTRKLLKRNKSFRKNKRHFRKSKRNRTKTNKKMSGGGNISLPLPQDLVNMWRDLEHKFSGLFHTAGGTPNTPSPSVTDQPELLKEKSFLPKLKSMKAANEAADLKVNQLLS